MEPRAAVLRYPLFAVLEPARLDAWLASGESRGVEMGETLFHAGTPGQHVYVVQEGRVRVHRAGKKGREVSLGTFRPGEVFGEYALLPPGLNTATCRAAGAARVWRLPLPALREVVAGQPELKKLKPWLRLHALLGYLREGSFLGFMSATSFVPLLDRCATVRFPTQHTLQADGLGADCWFVIREGRVRLRADADRYLSLGPGDSFGERALLGQGGLPLAEAEADTQCLVLRRDAFHHSPHGVSRVSQQTYLEQLTSPPRPYCWVAQQEATDCGAAALAMVARFHGLDVSVAQLRQGLRVDSRGVNLQALQAAAEALGFRSQTVRVGLDQLPDVALPAIAHLSNGHYVVVYALQPSHVVLGDPATGIVKTAALAFRQSWSGHLVLLTRAAAEG